MRHLRGRAEPERPGDVARAVAEWFANHASSMDHVLALYMKEKGYDPAASSH